MMPKSSIPRHQWGFPLGATVLVSIGGEERACRVYDVGMTIWRQGITHLGYKVAWCANGSPQGSFAVSDMKVICPRGVISNPKSKGVAKACRTCPKQLNCLSGG